MQTLRSKPHHGSRNTQAFITGEYSRFGYEILLHVHGQVSVVYRAGNHRQDSIVMVEATSPSALNLRQIRACCLRTAKDIAGEKKVSFGGVSRVEETKVEF